MEKSGNGDDSKWIIWYQDNFDYEYPRRIESTGEGILAGLKELWKLHLFETVQQSGQEGFSHFNLWWVRDKMSIRIVGSWDGQVKLRSWVCTGGMELKTTAKGTNFDEGLLAKIAETHWVLIQKGETSAALLDLARVMDRDGFERYLLDFLGEKD